MLFFEKLDLQMVLRKKANMNKVRDLFKAKEAIKQYARDLTDVRYTCRICGLSDYSCEHCGNCESYYYDTKYSFCQDCGGYLSE